MKLMYPSFTVKYNKEGNLVFTGVICPSPVMPEFIVSIEYRGVFTPRVRVLSPPLVEKPPHYYHSFDCLCLFKPDNFRWTDTKPISNYIVSWTSCWLYFYEVWKEKGIWYGPEAEHATQSEKHE
jgi:hypothetical protein